MENHEKSLRIDLENRPYRYLQKMTKSLSLPSNFKKIYLIDLIVARKRGKEDEVRRIIAKVKQERAKSSQFRRQSKRKTMQDTENIIARRLLYSPPITATPKHSQLTLQRLNKRRSLLKRLNESPYAEPNRMLHSCKGRNIRNVTDVIKAHTSGVCMKIVSRQNSFQLSELTVQLQPWATLTPVRHRHHMYHNKSTQSQSPARRQRTVSGIYPIQNDVQTNGVSLRRKDGTISIINAIVERRTYERKTQTDNTEDILNNLEETTPINNNLVQNLSITDSAFSEVNNSIDSCYSEVRVEDTMWKHENALPSISDAFSKFNGRDYSQPLYVQVSEYETIPMSTTYIPNPNPIILEKFYSFRTNSLANGLLQKATAAHTTSVFSTYTVMLTKVQPSATSMPLLHSYPSNSESFGRNDMNQHFGNYSSCSKQEMQQDSLYSEEVYNYSSASSVDTSQDIGASVTIPEMVEDALEIISQDGDYLERIGMDSTKLLCALCNWAGPTVMMEYHLRKEHADQILKQNKSEWNITYTLGSLVSDSMWHSKVIEYNSSFYVLSAKYEDPDCFMVTLSSLSPNIITNTGSITIYNKVTGEPHTWQGDIEPLPPNLPYKNHLNCLKLNLATLDLLPNSANLKLVNGELVMESPSKVVVGQPELNDIHIILFVRLLNF